MWCQAGGGHHSQQRMLKLEHIFVCYKCGFYLPKGDNINMISSHQMRADDDGSNFCATPDAASVVCPRLHCGAINIQCCHCSFTTSKDNMKKGRQALNLKFLGSKKYTRHYKSYHALPPNQNNSDGTTSGGDDNDNSIDSMDVSFEQVQGGFEILSGSVEINSVLDHDATGDDGTYDNNAILLPSGEEVVFEDFINQCIIDESLNNYITHLVNNIDSTAMTELKRHIETVFKNNDVSRRYFQLDLESWGRSGLQGIVGRAVGDNLAGETETSALLLLTKIMSKLAKDDRSALLKYNKHLVEMFAPYFVPNTRLPAVPTSEALFQKMVMGSDTALLDQLPKEIVYGGDVEGVDDKHASISINELINHEMATGKNYTWLVGETLFECNVCFYLQFSALLNH